MAVMPAHAFDQAVERWNAGEWFKKPMDMSGIFPRADQLADLAKPTQVELAKAAWRMRKANGRHQRVAAPEVGSDDEGRNDSGWISRRERQGDLGQEGGGNA